MNEVTNDTMRTQFIKKYMPLICVEIYLIVTLLLFYFGPVDFRIRNHETFISLIFSYHVMFVLGYLVGTWLSKDSTTPAQSAFNSKFFYVSFCLGFFGILISYKNLMLTPSLIPYDFFDNLINGILRPDIIYAERFRALESGATSNQRYLNIAFFFFAFFKLLFIFQFVYFWKNLLVFQKSLALIYSFFFVSAGLSSGTNSVVFAFFIFLIFSILVISYIRNYFNLGKLLLVFSLLSLVPVCSFGYILSRRLSGIGSDYFAKTSVLGDISIPNFFELDSSSTFFDFIYYTFVFLDFYLVQGYYGFSLITDLEHQWTYGFGNSAFLQRQLLLISGIDVSTLTFQHRISSYWHETVQWHSFYGQFANDFGLVGVAFFLMFLGFFFAKIWLSAIQKSSFFAAAMMPVFILMFIFFPANNQVLGYIDTLSYFVFVSLLWIIETKFRKMPNHV